MNIGHADSLARRGANNTSGAMNIEHTDTLAKRGANYTDANVPHCLRKKRPITLDSVRNGLPRGVQSLKHSI